MTKIQAATLAFAFFGFVFACALPGPDNADIAWDPITCFAGMVISLESMGICLLVDKIRSYRLPRPEGGDRL